MIKTITIIENEDGTQKVYLHNFERDGSEIKVDRATVKFNIEREHIGSTHTFSLFQAKITLNIDCLRGKDDKLFSIQTNRLTDEELLVELEKRKLLTKETVYKTNY